MAYSFRTCCKSENNENRVGQMGRGRCNNLFLLSQDWTVVLWKERSNTRCHIDEQTLPCPFCLCVCVCVFVCKGMCFCACACIHLCPNLKKKSNTLWSQWKRWKLHIDWKFALCPLYCLTANQSAFNNKHQSVCLWVNWRSLSSFSSSVFNNKH